MSEHKDHKSEHVTAHHVSPTAAAKLEAEEKARDAKNDAAAERGVSGPDPLARPAPKAVAPSRKMLAADGTETATVLIDPPTVSPSHEGQPHGVPRERRAFGERGSQAKPVHETNIGDVGDKPRGTIYQVDIPNCLVGPRLVAAADEHEALEIYMAVGRVTGHDQPARISKIEAGTLEKHLEIWGKLDKDNSTET